METEYVFLDTTEFDSAAFNFESPKLAALRERAEGGSVKILITDVVYGEVVNRIAKYSKTAIEKANKLFANLIESKEFRTLRHVLPATAKKFDAVTIDELRQVSKDNFDAYIEATNITLVSADGVGARSVLDLYFEKQPPFGDGQKKYEFPDAFSLIALKEFCEKNGIKTYVVSNDGDVQKFCTRVDEFILMPELEKFLALVNEHESNREELELFVKLFNVQFPDEIKVDIAKVVDDFEVVATRYPEYVEFENMEVIEVQLDSFNVIDSDESMVTVYVTANVSFRATASYSDYSHAIEDKEDYVWYGVETVERQIEDTVKEEGILEYEVLNYPPQGWDDISLVGSSLSPEPIDVNLSELIEAENQ